MSEHPGTSIGGINIENTAGCSDVTQNLGNFNINIGGGTLRQNFKRTSEKEKGKDEAPKKKRNMEEQKQKPSDVWSGLSDQPGEISLRQPERYCDKVENLTVKICSPEKIRDIEKMIKKGDAFKIAKSGNRGYVLILNNNFHGKDKRHGAKQDVENMKKLWEKLGCKVEVQEDLTANEIRDALQKIAKWDGIKAFDFLAVFLMSHGTLKNGEDSLNGSDGEPVYVDDDVLSKFDNKSCPFLHEKPKLFFFQFCRGEKIDSGVPCNDTENDLAESMQVYQIVNRDGSCLPRTSDMLLSFATLKGYVALRDDCDGSWFINAIANIFAEFAHEEHVADLMTKVRRAVVRKSGHTEVQHSNRTVKVRCREMSESLNRLTKKVYLMPNSDPLDE